LGITNDPALVDPKIRSLVTNSPQVFIASGLAISDGMLLRVGKFIRNSSAVMVLCTGINTDKEVIKYLKLLRPGDIISAGRFPVGYNGSHIMSGSKNGELSRIIYPKMGRIIAGVLT
jgi:hypothetical protein